VGGASQRASARNFNRFNGMVYVENNSATPSDYDVMLTANCNRRLLGAGCRGDSHQ